MSRKRRTRSKKRKLVQKPWTAPDGDQTWIDGAALHIVTPQAPAPEMLDLLADQIQQQLRNSPLWDELVASYGIPGAERVIQQCRARLA
jgi:hypothetical protein